MNYEILTTGTFKASTSITLERESLSYIRAFIAISGRAGKLGDEYFSY